MDKTASLLGMNVANLGIKVGKAGRNPTAERVKRMVRKAKSIGDDQGRKRGQEAAARAGRKAGKKTGRIQGALVGTAAGTTLAAAALANRKKDSE